MPTQTFFNLSKEKQDKIILSSKEEFSEYSFYDASINRIIKNAGISRGSFYLYFKNKEDVFVYLLDKCKFEFTEMVKEKVNKEKHKIDIFEVVILVFDYLTSEKLDKSDKEFIVKTFSIMDAKLSQHLLNFEELSIFDKHKECMEDYIIFDNLKITKVEDIIILMEILRSVFVSDISVYLDKKIEKSEARENLMKKIEFLKYGVSK